MCCINKIKKVKFMTVIKTTEDGWDCVPELKEVVTTYEKARNIIYENISVHVF